MSASLRERLEYTRSSTPLTELQREVLEDGWVTDAEWAEMTDLFMSCLAERDIVGVVGTVDLRIGVDTSTQDKFIAKYGDLDSAFRVIDPIVDRCSHESIGVIGPFYFEARNNPDGLDLLELTRVCMMRVGLTEYANISDDEIDRLFDDATFAFENPQGYECLISPSATNWRDHLADPSIP